MKKNRPGRLRLWIQAAAFALSNSYLAGFAEGKIYTGKSKYLCVPGLNCYSCPGARFSCPIGALQAVLNDRSFRLSCYVFGLITAFGAFLGRFVCGWLCPFGLIQDLLYKIPLFKKKKSLPGHRYLVYLKYVILLLFVFLLPAFLKDPVGIGTPWFCKYICPSGTLLAAIPLVLRNEALQKALGLLFDWKLLLLLAILLLSVKYYRPFCKYLCPLGGLYGLFNPIALYRYRLDEQKCTGCGACTAACRMEIDVRKNVNSPECIRCGDCRAACPHGAITTAVRMRKNEDV